MSTLRFLLSLAVSLALTTFVSANDDPTLEQRLERLAASLEAARIDAHIPGMSIAIVRDDEVIWARGFGLADIDAERAADENTIYAIGSTTKAFTATLIGMLVDEGKASWDDPVTEYLPYFDLAVRSDDENAVCTLRDLLSHRHGFSRMGILWFGGMISREEVLRTAAGAEPWADFREGFHYCNVTYLAAGVAAGVAVGSTWDDMLVERIFDPLEMTASTVSVTKAQADPRLARGYDWDEVDERFEQQKMIDLGSIGPAGAVNSNVLDMAQWVRLQLGRGAVDELRLISPERLAETWEPQIQIGAGVSYGMGWMLRDHDGRQVVEHGGNIDGFTAEVALMPEENLGYVLLMNVSASPFRERSLGMVFDALLGDWTEPTVMAAAGEIDFEEYTGLYIANFGQFRDEEFEILVEGDRLALDIPSQQTFELEQPDAEGTWSFVLTDQVAVSFDRDESGAVIALRVHQGGFNFEVTRKGLALGLEARAGALEMYIGTYVREEGGKRVKLSIERGRLTMEDKGKLLAFDTPGADGHASLRARADYGATFERDAEGNVVSFVFHGSAGDKLFTRLGDSPNAPLASLDEILALRRTDARIAAREAGGRTFGGKLSLPQAGVHGTVTIQALGSDRYATHLSFGKFGRADVVVRGKEAWSYNSMRGFDVLKGEELTQALLDHPGSVEGLWSDHFDSIEVIRNDMLNERPVHVLRLERDGVPSRTFWIDAEYGDVLRAKQIAIEGSIRIPVTIDYSNFEEFGGVRYAMQVTVENPMSGRTILTFETVELGLELDDDVFTLADPGARKHGQDQSDES